MRMFEELRYLAYLRSRTVAHTSESSSDDWLDEIDTTRMAACTWMGMLNVLLLCRWAETRDSCRFVKTILRQARSQLQRTLLSCIPTPCPVLSLGRQTTS